MKLSVKILIPVLLIIVPYLSIYAQLDTSVITAEDLWEMKRPGAPTVSPDGQKIAFTVTEYDIKENSSSVNIYLMPAEGGDARQFTTGGSDKSAMVASLT